MLTRCEGGRGQAQVEAVMDKGSAEGGRILKGFLVRLLLL